jgi:predicted small metal-binding protein
MKKIYCEDLGRACGYEAIGVTSDAAVNLIKHHLLTVHEADEEEVEDLSAELFDAVRDEEVSALDAEEAEEGELDDRFDRDVDALDAEEAEDEESY